MQKISRALISVSDKTGIVDFARSLHAQQVELLSTGGTARLLADNAIPVTEVSNFQFHYSFASFQEAASFVDREIGKIAEQNGYSPVVEIDGKDVVLTLGVETPQILTEGDFDFAEAVDGTFPEPEPPVATA